MNTKDLEKANELASILVADDQNNKPLVDLLLQMAEWKDKQTILEQSGWCFDKPTKDCFVLLLTKEFPKNCFYVVAEWDNDAQCFYSEATDYPIEKWDCWKMLEENLLLENKNYKEEVEFRKRVK